MQISNAAIVVENWPIERLSPYARNPRRNDDAVDRMTAAIQQFGFKIPILIRSNGQIVDGHLRLKAAKKLGLSDVPVILCDEWSGQQVKAFRLLVNKSATWADWDEELLSLELADLKDLEFDLALTGFDPSEIDELLFSSPPDAETDHVPAPPQNPVSRPGDLWLCGEHRVLCGDATSVDDVRHVLGTQRPLLMVTDPPYAVEYDPLWREEAGLGEQRQVGLVRNDDRVDWSAAFALFPGDVAYVWHAGVHAGEVATGLLASGWDIRSQIIWGKQHFALSRGHYHWQHEPCWYVVRKGRPSHWRGDRTQSTLWEVANLNPFGGHAEEETATGHGTQKPVELMRRPILNHTERAEHVYDPFLGSGTMLIAATLQTGICYGLEIEPAYVDVVVRRWQTLTGKQATLTPGGRTFAAVQGERHADQNQ